MIEKDIKPFYLGKKSLKNFGGKLTTTTPFLYTHDSFEKIGIGIQNSDGEGLIWGLRSPITIIRWWRSLKVLEALHTVENSTLADCWLATDEFPSETAIQKLSSKMGGYETFIILLNNIMNSVPSQMDLIGMINTLTSKGIKVKANEIADALKRGQLTPHKVFDLVIIRANKYKRALVKTEEKLPEKYRLDIFFQEIGLKQIYNQDEYIVFPADLDTTVRKYCFYDKKSAGYELFIAGQHRPTLTSLSGEVFTFLSAKFWHGRFYLKTKIKTPDGYLISQEYTLEQLRNIIGSLSFINYPTARTLLRKIFS